MKRERKTTDDTIQTLPEFLSRVRRLKGIAIGTAARAADIPPSTLSRIERVTRNPTPESVDHLAAPGAYGCPWWESVGNRTFLRELAAAITGQTVYANDTTTMYYVRSVVPICREQWFVPSAGREIVELWPALKLPGWRPTPGEPAHPVADPLWWWGASEAYRLGSNSDNRVRWDARWTTAADAPGEARDHLLALVVSHVAAGASRLSSGWVPKDEPPQSPPGDSDWWERYRERVLGLAIEDQVLVKALIDRLVRCKD